MFEEFTQKIAAFFSATFPPRPELIDGEIKDLSTQTVYKTASKVAGLVSFEYADLSPSLSPAGMPVFGTVLWNLTVRDSTGVARTVPLYHEERANLLRSFQQQIAERGVVTEIPGFPFDLKNPPSLPDNEERRT